MTFNESDKLKALAIVHIFETSRPFGNYAAVAVLNDGAGVSYGINQFTHRSGSLAIVVETYLHNGGRIGREILAQALPVLRSTSDSSINVLTSDECFKKALRSAAVTREMKAAQNEIAFEKYLGPAIEICVAKGFVMPLSLAVVYDSVTHGSWGKTEQSVQAPRGGTQYFEQAWITEYVRKRHFWLTNVPRLKATNYRTKFFLNQIAIGNWHLRLPIIVHGVRLTDTVMRVRSEAPASAASKDLGAKTTNSRSVLRSAGEIVSSAADKFDRVDAIVTGVATRTDRAKSLWTTVIGTIWQMAWAIFGFVIGLPKVVWIVVAVIAAALMLGFLYRQIELGRIGKEDHERHKKHFIGMGKLAVVGFCGDRGEDVDIDHLGDRAADRLLHDRKDGGCAAADIFPAVQEIGVDTVMKLQTKIYIALAAAAIFAIGILGGAAWSNHKIAKLERAVDEAKAEALGSQQSAVSKEIEAAQYKQKIEYLESQLSEIQTIARKQDEELEKFSNNSTVARGDVERARRTRSIDANADELCKKLAELGHACR